MSKSKKPTEIINKPKYFWSGDSRVDPYMHPVIEAIDRHVPKGDAWTDIYNRAYEAVYNVMKDYGGLK